MSTFRPRTRTTQTFGLLVAFVGMAFGDSVLADILGRFLFKKPRPGLPGSEILMKLEIDLAEAARGCPRDIGVSRHEFCTSCAGSGSRWASLRRVAMCAMGRARSSASVESFPPPPSARPGGQSASNHQPVPRVSRIGTRTSRRLAPRRYPAGRGNRHVASTAESRRAG